MRNFSLNLNSYILVLCGAMLTLNAGCRTYQFGTASLYPQDVRTVYVPMIESDSYRRNLGERLTEAVVKEIESKAGYKVVHYPNADTTLRVRLLSDTKRIITPSVTDEPRDLELTLRASAIWMRRDGEVIAHQSNLALAPNIVNLTATAQARPEIGDSIASTQQKAIQRLARQIVEMMETPW